MYPSRTCWHSAVGVALMQQGATVGDCFNLRHQSEAGTKQMQLALQEVAYGPTQSEHLGSTETVGCTDLVIHIS